MTEFSNTAGNNNAPGSREFSRSVAANAAAQTAILAARDGGWLDRPIGVASELAENEKALLIKIFSALAEAKKCGKTTLDDNELSSMFTFVFARAAEAVTSFHDHKPFECEMKGLFDGRIPIYAAEHLTAFCKSCDYPTECARRYRDWHAENPEFDDASDLTLGEALKWCFRLSCHIILTQLPETE